jgi:hypothetical protein
MYNIVPYRCLFDNNVELKVIKYTGNNKKLKQMYDFYNGGSLLLREQKKKTNYIKFDKQKYN